MAPDIMGVMRPHEQHIDQRCDTTYHEGDGSASGASCHCGIFAIGHCGRCGQLVCGVHSAVGTGVLTCDRCLRVEDEAARNAEQARSAYAAARRQAAEDEAARTAAAKDAAYRSLPEMGVNEMTHWLQGGNFGEGPGEGGSWRLPEQIDDATITAVLSKVPPTAKLVPVSLRTGSSFGRRRWLAPRVPAWRFGTHTSSHANAMGSWTTYAPVFLLGDLTVRVAHVRSSRTAVMATVPDIQLPHWDRSRQAMQRLRHEYAKGVTTPGPVWIPSRA